MAEPNPAVLLAQLKALTQNPEAFSEHRNEIIELSRKNILQSHIPALEAGSVILIDDKVIPNEKAAGEYTAGLSLAMLVMFNALERKESQWRELIEEAGCKIKEIKRYTDFGDSIIVVVKK